MILTFCLTQQEVRRVYMSLEEADENFNGWIIEDGYVLNLHNLMNYLIVCCSIFLLHFSATVLKALRISLL